MRGGDYIRGKGISYAVSYRYGRSFPSMRNLRSLLQIDLGVPGLLITIAGLAGGFCLLLVFLTWEPARPPLPLAPPPAAAEPAFEAAPEAPAAAVEEEVEPSVEIAENGDLRLEVRLHPLRREKRKLTFEDHDDGSPVLAQIDGEDYYGTDGSVPRREIAAVELCWGGQPFALSRNGFRDLFDCRPSGISASGDTLELGINGGDGSASFEAAFSFSRATLKGNRTIIGNWNLQEEEIPGPSELPNRSVSLRLLGTKGSNPCSRRTEVPHE
jgi:hypothetical protein